MTLITGGYAPDYQMRTTLGVVQPIFAIDMLVWCPAENWERISTGIGYYPAICPANGLMHTSYPDPETRRRMREAWNRR